MSKKEIIVLVVSGILAIAFGVATILLDNVATKDSNVKAEVAQKQMTIKQSLALDLLQEFEEDMNGKFKEAGIEMSIVYNDKEYTRVSDFEKDIK